MSSRRFSLACLLCLDSPELAAVRQRELNIL